MEVKWKIVMLEVKWKIVVFLLAAIIMLASSVSTEPGSCPPTLPVDICHAACGTLTPCEAPKICCPTACMGAMCVDPVTKRHFVNLVKPGRCPEYPRGPWVCTHMCTSDSDCPRTLRCCANRCGALVCQRPELEDNVIMEPIA